MHLIMKVPAKKVKENLESLLKDLVNGILITDMGDYVRDHFDFFYLSIIKLYICKLSPYLNRKANLMSF